MRQNWMNSIRGLIRSDYFILCIGVILAMILRVTLFSFESGDYLPRGEITDPRLFVGEWYAYLKQNGIAAFHDGFYNYAPLYLYLLYFASLMIPFLPNLIGIKLVSVLFDFVCAAFAYKLVRTKYVHGPLPLFAFLAVLYAPTVVLNSSLWGQADSLYTAALVACLYFLLKKREPLAFALLGVAFAFKLQALFLTPLLILLCLRGMVSWKNFLLVPIVYLVTILPTWLAGRRLIDLLTIYVAQGTTYRQLSEHAPNMYTWFPNDYYDLLFPAGIVWAGIVVFLFIVVAFKSPATITSPLVVEIATLSALIVPYCLPKMHERYFFPADVLSIIFAFFFPRYALVAVAIGMTSFFAYLPFLFEHEVIPLPLLALALLSVISVMAQHLIRLLWSTGSQRSYDGVS